MKGQECFYCGGKFKLSKFCCKCDEWFGSQYMHYLCFDCASNLNNETGIQKLNERHNMLAKKLAEITITQMEMEGVISTERDEKTGKLNIIKGALFDDFPKDTSEENNK